MLDFLLRLEPRTAQPLYVQLAGQLREAILAGRLEAGLKLPSTRALADHLGVSRNTVTEAYAELLASGFIAARPGSGNFVAVEGFAAASPRPGGAGTAASPVPAAEPAALSSWARRLPLSGSGQAVARRELPYDFRINAAAWEAFPYEAWRRLAARAWRQTSAEAMGYGEPAGWRRCARRSRLTWAARAASRPTRTAW